MTKSKFKWYLIFMPWRVKKIIEELEKNRDIWITALHAVKQGKENNVQSFIKSLLADDKLEVFKNPEGYTTQLKWNTQARVWQIHLNKI